MLTKNRLAAVLGVGATALIAGLGIGARPASAAPWGPPAPPALFAADRHDDHGNWERDSQRRRHEEWLRRQELQRERERFYHERQYSGGDYGNRDRDHDWNHDRDQNRDRDRDNGQYRDRHDDNH